MNFVCQPPFLARPTLIALLLAPVFGQAANTATTPPDAGSILQQVQPALPPVPSSTRPALTIEPGDGKQADASVSFEVKGIRIEGNTLLDTATLHALVAEGEGKRLTLRELDALISRITEHYQRNGYLLARAIIPAQTMTDGMVRIQVVEARYGQITLNNSSLVSDALLQATLASLQSGQPVSAPEMERTLLLLSDIPGMSIDATLGPGANVGTSDLALHATPGPRLSGNVELDDYGNRYIGRTRLGASGSMTNLLHHGDVLGANLVSTGSGMNYGRISYESWINGNGTRIGSAYSAVHYALADSMTALNAHGTADVASLWVKHPLLRGKAFNLYGQLQFDDKQLADHVDTGKIRTDRHLHNGIASLNGDARDTLLGGGINAWSLAWTSGKVNFDNAEARHEDGRAARTQGSFAKWNVNLTRLQRLTDTNFLYVNLAGQWANANLDSAEKLSVGGPYTVRAYEMGVVSGDSGYLGSLELRHQMGKVLGGDWQALAFFDSAHITLNHTPWTRAANSGTLSGAGLGLNWNRPDGWRASAYLASKTGSATTLVTDAPSSRFWCVIGKAF